MKLLSYLPVVIALFIVGIVGLAIATPIQPGALGGCQYNATPLVLSDGQQATVQCDTAGNQKVTSAPTPGGVPAGATTLSASSGDVAAGTATATLPGSVGKTTYITGFQITFSGATAASCVIATVTGTIATAPSFTVCEVAGSTTQGSPLIVNFPTPIPASGTNTAIVVTLPSLGAGDNNAIVNAQGYSV